MFQVVITSRAEHQFAKLPSDLKQKFYEEFKELSSNPFANPRVKKIQGIKNGYRLRVGRWRILFALFSKEKQIEIVDIFLEKGKKDYVKRKKLLS
ncbi:type II toxin-antitoxin system RelE/ParE family toxin [Candidatus Parcubacteria bacterium]|nr:type II toxin-antitoxin system RelE/ParE family toxin [Candidatus Parcubacteria bacterium]